MTTTILYFVVRFYEKKVNDNKKYLITMIRKILKSRKVIVINY